MPISIRYKNDPNQECVLRPAPLISISTQVLRSKEGVFGKTYNITLTGSLIVEHGFPLAKRSTTDTFFPYWDDTMPSGGKGPYGAFDPTWSHAYEDGDYKRPKRQFVPYEEALDAMMFKQRVLRELFSRDGQRVEIIPISAEEPALICYPRLVSIDFTEGIYTDYTTYTVVLEADTLLDNALLVDMDGNPIESNDLLSEKQIFDLKWRFIESYTDTWNLDTNDTPEGDVSRTYTITRNISAVGKDHYSPGLDDGNNNSVKKTKAWENARDFVHSRITNGNLPNEYPNVNGMIGSGVINLISDYKGYNHLRNESIDVAGGSYSLTETWNLAQGTAYEDYQSSIDVGIDGPFVKVGINGNIKGMINAPPSGKIFGGDFETNPKDRYINSLTKYYEISDSGRFGIGSDVFKRANNLVAVQLNAQPMSVSVSFNEQKGEIGYTVNYDNRPTNIISGVLTEEISVNDTHPGDVFATIPIIGRKTGPILQHIGTRTEYTRNVSVNLQLDYNDVAYGSGKASLIKQKPSVVSPMREQLISLLQELSPSGEVGVRKYFINPPQESWNPKTGVYSIQVDWVYEKDR
jgi:hypothetical protein